MAIALFHGNGWAIILGLVATVMLYLVLPVMAVVLAMKYLRGRKGPQSDQDLEK